MYDALVDKIREALGRRGGSMNARAIPELIAGLHPSDLAFILDELTLPEAECVFVMLDDDRAAEALSQVAPATNRHLIQTSPTTRILTSGLVGADAAEMDRRTPTQVARLRLPWLLGTMAIELGAGIIISRFDKVLRDVILLASFMPVISAVSGNVGLQAAAIVVRGLDTGHVSLETWVQAVRRELATALTLAFVAGLALAVVAVVWSKHVPFGLVVGAAMTCAIVTAGFMGTVIPMLSKRFGFDPATTAGPFETAFQDVIGFTVFLWMASRLTRWLV